MSAKQPAMSPSDMPVDSVLGKASGPRRAEADELLRMFSEISGDKPVVWAGRIIGFGEYEYRYPSGHGGKAPLLAFAVTKTHHTIYLVSNYADLWPELLEKLGNYRASKACLYLSRLSGVNIVVLRELIERSMRESMHEAVRE
ncbi:DUF1801 domain-containing protein [Nesterenkonia alkaliphila]|uniref:DUF1801 domain-containing protein n=1 Tax=Nesterenkonia alkaliphila TaxID=1463631 RepID=A0A7K1ULK2_9MICC|nr:DUF1801 domain-containing protein [Nesterenkonia alkaliphila]MVT26911.1 DUF1801 domain-containing protein [Nesterenkonia alkaliphila]GGA00131.1 hypothetical protein GCM10011359_31040 [Nesterenkonia alkaliphila]